MSSKTQLEYHLVFVTKYRKPALLGIEDAVYRAVKNAEKRGNFTVIEQAVDLGDHLHLVITAPPNLSVSSIVNRLKQLTTLELYSTQPAVLRKYYWKKKKKVLWSAGYFAGTIGSVSKENILDYVRRQKN